MWVSRDYARSFYQLTDHAPWPARADAPLSVSKAGVLVITGGQANSFYYVYNGRLTLSTAAQRHAALRHTACSRLHPACLSAADVWASLDGGYSWVQLAQYPYFTPRNYMAATFDQNDVYYVMAGGRAQSYGQSNDVYRSSLSFANIAQWGPNLVPGLVVPGSGSTACLGLTCFPQDFPACVCAQTNTALGALPFSIIPTTASGVAPFTPRSNFATLVLNNGLTYNNVSWNGAPAGSLWAPPGTWLVVGGGLDTWISTTQGQTWYGIAGTTGLPYALGGPFALEAGQAICKDPNTDQIYMIGGTIGNYATIFSSLSQPGSGSTLGQYWFIVNNVTPFPGRAYFGCIVDSSSTLWVVAGDTYDGSASYTTADTWLSTNGGQSFLYQQTTQSWPTNGNVGRQAFSVVGFQSQVMGSWLTYVIGGVAPGGQYGVNYNGQTGGR